MKTIELDVVGKGDAPPDAATGISAGRVEHLSMAERAARGHAARKAAFAVIAQRVAASSGPARTG